MLRPAASFVLVAVVFVRSGCGFEPPWCPDNRAAPARDEMDPVGVAPTMSSPPSITGATTPARGARAELLLRAHASPVLHDRGRSFVRERRPRRPRSGGCQESRTSASISTWPATRAAVMRWRPSRTKSVSPARVSRTGGGSRPSSSHARYRSILARSRPRSRRRMSASGTHVDVNDAYATRLLPRGRFECGRVESNHHSHWRRGYSALSSPVLGVRRESVAATERSPASIAAASRRLGMCPAGTRVPRNPRRRPVGLEPTLRGSRPRMLAVTSRPPGEMEGGIGSPQPEAETLPSRSAPEPAVVPLGSSCQRVATPPPPHRLALEACRPSCTLGPALCPALVPSLPRPARRRVDPRNSQ